MKPLIAEVKLTLILKQEEGVGYYLFVYPEKSGISIADHLQDTLEITLEQAETEYGVPRSAWKEISQEQLNYFNTD